MMLRDIEASVAAYSITIDRLGMLSRRWERDFASPAFSIVDLPRLAIRSPRESLEMLIVKIIGLGFLFVVTGGDVFAEWGRKHRVLAAFAAFFALISAFYLIRDIYIDIEYAFSNFEQTSTLFWVMAVLFIVAGAATGIYLFRFADQDAEQIPHRSNIPVAANQQQGFHKKLTANTRQLKPTKLNITSIFTNNYNII